MRKVFNYSIAILIACTLLLISGCQKDAIPLKSSPEQDLFFNNETYFATNFPNVKTTELENRNAEVEANIKLIKQRLKELDDQHGFITKLITHYGMPLWGRPIISDSVSNNVDYVYTFPLLTPQNEFTNGYIKVLKNNNGVFVFSITNETEFYEDYINDIHDIQFLEKIALLQQFNIKIFNKTRKLYNYSLIYYKDNHPDRVLPRSGCWDDVVVSVSYAYGFQYIEAPGQTAEEIMANRIAGYQAYKVEIEVHFITMRMWIPNCVGLDDAWLDYLNQLPGNGGPNPPGPSQWEYLSDIYMKKINACLASGPDDTGGIDVESTSPETDAAFAQTCLDVWELAKCLDPENYPYGDGRRNIKDIILAKDLGLLSSDDIDAISENCNNVENINKVLQDYFHCINVTNSLGSTEHRKLDDYLYLHKTISDLKKQNTATSNALAEQLESSLCRQSSNGLEYENIAEIANCINNAKGTEKDKADLMDFYFNAELIDPCTGSKIDKSQFFNNMCASGKSPSMAKLNEQLAGVDHIIVNASLNDCPLLKCAIATAQKATQSRMCDIIKDMESNSKIEVKLKMKEPTDPAFEFGDNVPAVTIIDKITGQSTIYFNPIFCKTLESSSESDKLNMVLAVHHELLHADLYNKMVAIYIKNGHSIPMTRRQFFENFTSILAEEVYDMKINNGSEAQHLIIGTKYVNDLATALWEANGKKGNPDDYLWHAWQGLYKEGETPKEYMTKERHDAMYQNFVNNVGKIEIKC